MHEIAGKNFPIDARNWQRRGGRGQGQSFVFAAIAGKMGVGAFFRWMPGRVHSMTIAVVMGILIALGLCRKFLSCGVDVLMRAALDTPAVQCGCLEQKIEEDKRTWEKIPDGQ